MNIHRIIDIAFWVIIIYFGANGIYNNYKGDNVIASIYTLGSLLAMCCKYIFNLEDKLNEHIRETM